MKKILIVLLLLISANLFAYSDINQWTINEIYKNGYKIVATVKKTLNSSLMQVLIRLK